MHVDTIDTQLEWLKPLLTLLRQTKPEQRLACLQGFELVVQFLISRRRLSQQISTLSPTQQLAIYALIAVGQGPYVLEFSDRHISQEDLERLASILGEVGGILWFSRGNSRLSRCCVGINSRKRFESAWQSERCEVQ